MNLRMLKNTWSQVASLDFHLSNGQDDLVSDLQRQLSLPDAFLTCKRALLPVRVQEEEVQAVHGGQDHRNPEWDPRCH